MWLGKNIEWPSKKNRLCFGTFQFYMQTGARIGCAKSLRNPLKGYRVLWYSCHKQLFERSVHVIYSTEVEHMCPVIKGAYHGPAPIPQEGKWVQAKEVSDISGLTHGVGWCAPQQGACKLTLNVKDGVIEEALVETIGCTGMTHSAAMAAEILPGKTILEALNTDLVCDAINVAMRELFLQIAYGRSQTAFSEGGLPIGASLEDLGKNLRSQIGTLFGTKAKGARYLELCEGYINRLALDEDNAIIGYEFINLGKMMDAIKKGEDAKEALEKAKGHYGRFDEAAKYIDPRKE
jgi:NifU-like protein involved in Fe-S cluster formation